MAVTDSIAAIKQDGKACFSALVFQPDIAQNSALAFRRESFASKLEMQIALKIAVDRLPFPVYAHE